MSKGHQKSDLVACDSRQVLSLCADSQPWDATGNEGLRLDDRGMVLPHSILGSLEVFGSYLEVRGETELVKLIPKSKKDPSPNIPGRPRSEAVENKQGVPSGQRNALQHWQAHMRQRRQQQDFLSRLICRPVENLLMNQTSRFREIQEQKEFLNEVLPLIRSGNGHYVGNEFWSLPRRYGDEISGITATLTLKERGKWEPVTHVGQPRSMSWESGVTCGKTPHPSTWTRDKSVYLQQLQRELKDAQWVIDANKLDVSGLEIIGSGQLVTVGGPSLDEEEEEREMNKDDVHHLALQDDLCARTWLIPALRFCGHLASWTGNTPSRQGAVGVSATILFEVLTGDQASSQLELHNEGSTAIVFSWQQLPLQRHFYNQQSQTNGPVFLFNSSCGVILPGDTQRVEFIFKSECPGIKTEVWQLNTHPLLLQGAALHVMLRGLSVDRDRTQNQRQIIDSELESAVIVEMCRSMVSMVFKGVIPPERPGSPAEDYITEEQRFHSKNPKFRDLDQSVMELKRLWQEVAPGRTWDLSVDTLRQAMLSLPGQGSADGTMTKEEGLSRFNVVLLKLCESPPPKLMETE
ncbi:MYCBP-associated protein-like [Aulostomus maculatus]